MEAPSNGQRGYMWKSISRKGQRYLGLFKTASQTSLKDQNVSKLNSSSNSAVLRGAESAGMSTLPSSSFMDLHKVELDENIGSEYRLSIDSQCVLNAKKSPDFYRFESAHSGYNHHENLNTTFHDGLMETGVISLSTISKKQLFSNLIETISINHGDDAMIVSPNLLGVADGVSGWSGQHANSGLFAKNFLEGISKNFTELSYKNSSQLSNITDEQLSLKIDQAYLDSIKVMEEAEFKGSSTLLVAMIIDKCLKIINIGDSKIFIVRDGHVVLSNTEQYIGRLCPEQVGTSDVSKLPSKVMELLNFELQEDDLVLMCSDGVSDNLYEDQLLEIINKYELKNHAELQELADKLLYTCKSIAFDNYSITPYVEKVNDISNNLITGGKVDDISICVSKVRIN